MATRSASGAPQSPVRRWEQLEGISSLATPTKRRPMPHKLPITRPEQDAFLLEIYAIANRVAEEKKLEQAKGEDVVHDLILDCLRALRWEMDVHWGASLQKFVEQELVDRLWRGDKSRLARKVRERAFYEVIEDAPREWMSQDLKMEADTLEDFAASVRRTLPPAVGKAHRLVRDERLTYAQAARKVRRSSAFVHRAVTRVQEAFRARMPAMDIEPPRSTHGGRLPRNRSSGTSSRAQRLPRASERRGGSAFLLDRRNRRDTRITPEGHE